MSQRLTFGIVQLLDLPGIIEGAKDGKGRGRQVIAVARTCNLIMLVLDSLKPMQHKIIIERELEGFGIRLNKEPPNLTFRRKEKGGINFTSTVVTTHLDSDTVKAICSEVCTFSLSLSCHRCCARATVVLMTRRACIVVQNPQCRCVSSMRCNCR
jgi:ribosome-interacting GTPase 1